jgi:hypothetical protein
MSFTETVSAHVMITDVNENLLFAYRYYVLCLPALYVVEYSESFVVLIFIPGIEALNVVFMVSMPVSSSRLKFNCNLFTQNL